MRHTWLVPVIAYAALFTTPGCATSDPFEDALRQSDESVGAVESPIQGGYLDETDTHVVGLIHFDNSSFGGCTGTLIAPNVVLTAQHCIAPISNSSGAVACGQTYFLDAHDPDSMYVTTRTQFTQNPADYRQGKEIFVPSEDSEVCGADIAIIVLDEPIPESEAVPMVPRVDSSIQAGDEYYAVGYGQQFDGNNAPSGTRYRRDNLFTDCVADACPSPTIYPTEFQGDTGICQGDSGGPAIDMQQRVVGVASRGGPGCTSPVYGHVFGHGQWIKDVVGYATSANGLEIPPWATGFPTDPEFSLPVGGACSVPDECPSGLCLNGLCTRPCNDIAYCPQGFVCGGSGYCETPQPIAPDDDGGGSTTVTSCTVSLAGTGQDPTKPIPWIITPLALAGLLLLRRRQDD